MFMAGVWPWGIVLVGPVSVHLGDGDAVHCGCPKVAFAGRENRHITLRIRRDTEIVWQDFVFMLSRIIPGPDASPDLCQMLTNPGPTLHVCKPKDTNVRADTLHAAIG